VIELCQAQDQKQTVVRWALLREYGSPAESEDARLAAFGALCAVKGWLEHYLKEQG
jgi:hypothetical protein